MARFDSEIEPTEEQRAYNTAALAAAMRGAAGMISPTSGSPGAAAIAGLRSLLPGGGSFGEESQRYNDAAAPGIYSTPSVMDSRVEGLPAQTPEEAMRNPLLALQPVWHGTPHAWEGAGAPLEAAKGKTFDLSKMGTGEGAQAYGWGAYATKEPRVAESYRATLAAKGADPVLEIAGKPVRTAAPDTDFWPHDISVNREIGYGMRRGLSAKEAIRKQVAEADAQIQAYGSAMQKGPAAAEQYGPVVQGYQNRKAYLESLNPAEIQLKDPPGRLYKLDAPEDSELLHFEKSLAEQPHVIAAIAKDPGLQAGLKPHNFKWRGNEPTVDPSRISMTGEAYHRALADALGEKGASEALRAAGIPGHLYRGDSSGVENMVIYDPARAPVMEAYPSLSEMQRLANAVRGKDSP